MEDVTCLTKYIYCWGLLLSRYELWESWHWKKGRRRNFEPWKVVFAPFALVLCCSSYAPPVRVTTAWCLMVWAAAHPQPGRSAWPGRAGGRPAPSSSSLASWTPLRKNLLASDLWASSNLVKFSTLICSFKLASFMITTMNKPCSFHS